MQNLLNIVLPRLVWFYLHFVGVTSMVYWLHNESRQSLEKKNKSFIYAFWHGRQVFLPWAYRNFPYTTLVSQSKDGEYIARVIHLFGMQTVRGSSSRGGARAIIELKKRLESGNTVCITPDGPKGPQKQIAPGILYLARKTDRAILPITYSAKRKIVFHGWDDYWIPLPFNKIMVSYGNPVTILPADNLEQKSAELSLDLNRITREADAFCTEQLDAFSLKSGLSKINPLPPYSQYRPFLNKSVEFIFYFFYTLGIILFSPLILFSLFLRYPKTFLHHFHEGLIMRLGWVRKPAVTGNQKTLWMHASSLGECRAALPLIRAVKEKYPDLPIVFSCTTPNGIFEATRLQLGSVIFYSPIDLPFILRNVIRSMKPKIILLLESEIWPNWIRVAHDQGIKIGIVNGRISRTSAERYRMAAWASKILMNKIDFVCAREETDARRFEKMGLSVNKISVTGNLKFDFFPWTLNGKPGSGSSSETILKDRIIWVAGSIREGEEESILQTYISARRRIPDLKLIYSPRHIENLKPAINILKSSALSFTFRSAADRENQSWDVLVWDTFGDLWKAYKEAQIVFIGGSLVNKGGQNPIEPAWFSKPVIFGPSMENFEEPARKLLEFQGAVKVKNAEELLEKIVELMSQPEKRTLIGNNARRMVETFSGSATQKTLTVIDSYLNA